MVLGPVTPKRLVYSFLSTLIEINLEFHHMVSCVKIIYTELEQMGVTQNPIKALMGSKQIKNWLTYLSLMKNDKKWTKSI